MHDFKLSMEDTLELSTRIGRRTTTIIRMGMLSVFILAACMLYLIATLAGDFSRITQNMVLISENITTMNASFDSVSGNLQHIDNTLTDMNRSVQVLPKMDVKLGLMGNSTYSMSKDLRVMVDRIDLMQSDVASMSNDLGAMNRSVDGINRSVSNMTGSMYRMDNQIYNMSRPMEFFPFK